MTESVGSRNGDGGSGSFFGVKFELDFDSQGSRRTKFEYDLAMKKSTIDGD
jgi:hypothetical protein